MTWNGNNPCPVDCYCRTGIAGRSMRFKRLLGFVPSWIETFSARGVKMQSLAGRGFSSRSSGDARAFALSVAM